MTPLLGDFQAQFIIKITLVKSTKGKSIVSLHEYEFDILSILFGNHSK